MAYSLNPDNFADQEGAFGPSSFRYTVPATVNGTPGSYIRFPTSKGYYQKFMPSGDSQVIGAPTNSKVNNSPYMWVPGSPYPEAVAPSVGFTASNPNRPGASPTIFNSPIDWATGLPLDSRSGFTLSGGGGGGQSPFSFDPLLSQSNKLPDVPQLSFDPLLSPESILAKSDAAVKAAQAPIDVSSIVNPQIPLLTQELNNQLNVNKASAQSDFLARGLTGSSSELQTLTRELPAAANKALAEGIIKLQTQAIPLAQNEKQLASDAAFKSASLTTQLRTTIGEEQFNRLSLVQKQQLAEADMKLQRELKSIDQQFAERTQEAQFAFQRSENDKDRAIAETQYQNLQDERKRSRQGAFFSGLTSIAGLGIGAYFGDPTTGLLAGNAAGSAFQNLFQLP